MRRVHRTPQAHRARRVLPFLLLAEVILRVDCLLIDLQDYIAAGEADIIGERTRPHIRDDHALSRYIQPLGNVVRHVQVGFVRSYAAIILVGALAVLGYFIYYGLKLVV